MPNNIMLTFQRHKLCGGEDVYAVKQAGGNKIQIADLGDKITFKRTGQDANKGLKVVFHSADSPPQAVPGPFVSPGGNDEVEWTVDKSGHFKYDVEFPNDMPAVSKLDPIIIINPRHAFTPKPFVTVREVVFFVVGAALTFIGLRLF